MKYYVYGAGSFSECIVNVASKQGFEINAVIDKYTTKEQICNIPVVRLSQGLDRKATIFISTYASIQGEVIEELTKMGFETILSLEMTLAKFEESIRCIAKSQVWYRDDSSLFSNELKIQETKKLLFDKESINILDSVVSFRQNLSSDTFFAGDASSQYFPNDIPWMDAIDSFRFIDGGSFTGDTLEHLVKISDKFDKKIDQVALFEPDSNNLKDLNSLCESYAGKFEYYIYPCGLWNKNEVLHFSMNSSSGCIVHDNLSLDNDIVSIMGVSIDSTLFGARPNFIKMDIEGAERDAIKGAKETIEKYSPILAIAIYHRPDDLWSIPLLINQINPNYDMYIRSHGNFTLETILYAIPKNK